MFAKYGDIINLDFIEYIIYIFICFVVNELSIVDKMMMRLAIGFRSCLLKLFERVIVYLMSNKK